MIAPPHLRALLARSALLCPAIAPQAADAPAVDGSCADARRARVCRCRRCSPPLPRRGAQRSAAPGQASARPRSATTSPTSSDQLTTTADGMTVLTGNVDVHMGEREIQADQLTYDRDNNSINVSGQVRFRDPTVLVQGDTGHYGDDGALFNHAQFQLLQQPGHGSADQIAMSPSNVITLRNVIYTSCPQPHADWQIRARELRLDTAAGEASAAARSWTSRAFRSSTCRGSRFR